MRQAMQLNPYHPPRYWTHLARALFYQGRFKETLEVLDNLTRPRPDDLAYRIAANVRRGDEGAVHGLAELRAACPGFDVAAFVASLGYEREEDARALLAPLLQADGKDG